MSNENILHVLTDGNETAINDFGFYSSIEK